MRIGLSPLDENARIVIIDRGPYVSFANCGLPYCVGDVITDESKLLVANAASFANIAPEPAEAIPAHSTIREAVAKMAEKSMSLLLISSATENTLIGILTLHDVLRLQNQLSDHDELRVLTLYQLLDRIRYLTLLVAGDRAHRQLRISPIKRP